MSFEKLKAILRRFKTFSFWAVSGGRNVWFFLAHLKRWNKKQRKKIEENTSKWFAECWSNHILLFRKRIRRLFPILILNCTRAMGNNGSENAAFNYLTNNIKTNAVTLKNGNVLLSQVCSKTRKSENFET